MPDSTATEFAPAGRECLDTICSQAALFTSFRLLPALMSYIPDIVLILNRQRQVVYGNEAAVRAFQFGSASELLGLRPGELMKCRHATAAEGGCGTTQFCRCCGAVKAILESQAGRAATEECRVTVGEEPGGTALDLRVWATPMEFEGEQFTFFVLADIADEKRRQVLERSFLHDIIGTAMSLRAVTELLRTRPSAARPAAASLQHDYVHQLRILSDHILDQLEAHRQLVAAESGELVVHPSPVRSVELIEDVCDAHRSAFPERGLRIAEDTADILFESDKVLLGRVLSNLVRNALEASAPGDVVTAGCKLDNSGVVFWVHNKAFMPEKVQLQLFSRSFSTKGVGRGIGTYTIRRLTERYLGGTVSFSSSEAEGTTFYASYPLALPAKAPSYAL